MREFYISHALLMQLLEVFFHDLSYPQYSFPSLRLSGNFVKMIFCEMSHGNIGRYLGGDLILYRNVLRHIMPYESTCNNM